MPTIYLDRYQSDEFDLPYFEPGEARLTGSDILNTKHSGYDEYHRELLEPISNKSIDIERESGDPPGWWSIKRVYP